MYIFFITVNATVTLTASAAQIDRSKFFFFFSKDVLITMKFTGVVSSNQQHKRIKLLDVILWPTIHVRH
jgi:hypothetical protein